MDQIIKLPIKIIMVPVIRMVDGLSLESFKTYVCHLFGNKAGKSPSMMSAMAKASSNVYNIVC